jgi:hypothetical protein
MVSDAHVHFFSRAFFELLAAEAAAAHGGAPEDLLADLVRKAGLELPAPEPAVHARRWLAELDRHGVTRAVVFASHPREAEAVLEGTRAAGSRLVPYLLVNGATEAGLRAGARGLAEEGFRGLLLFPAVHHFDPSGAALDPLYAEAGARRAPVVVHCGLIQIKLRDLLGVRPHYDIRHASPLLLVAAAERHRSTRFIIPHFGGGLFAEALLAGAQSPNIYLDTSSSNSWRRSSPLDLTLEKVLSKAVDVLGCERLLFGTDSSVFPRGWRADILEAQEQAARTIGLDERQRERVFGENLEEMLS